MNKILSLITFLTISLSASAQELANEYITSEDGFAYLECEAVTDYGNYRFEGLFSKDGKILVSASYCRPTDTYYVPYGTEVIASRAFYPLSGLRIYIPSTVKSIAPDAIISYGSNPNKIWGINDRCIVVAPAKANALTTDRVNSKEANRFNTQGVRVSDNEEGVQIIQYNDGSSQKVIKK